MVSTARLSASTSSRCILVVDPHRWFGELVTTRLQRKGVRVCSPDDQDQALLAATQFQPDTAVVAIRPPDHEGLGLIERLAGLSQDMRIIALLASESRVVGERARLAGASLCLQRESGLAVLLSALNDAASQPESPASIPTLEDVKRQHIQAVLGWTGGNVTQAARLLGLHRASLQRMLNRMSPAQELPARRGPTRRRRRRAASS